MKALVLDLDGVIRHFDPARLGEVEQRHGLSAGVILDAAFTPDLLRPAVTGSLTRQEWTVAVGERIGSAPAAQEWAADPGRIDEEVIEVVRSVRGRGIRVAVLTNGTSAIAAELRHLGVDGEFDAVFNSYDIGVAKPATELFRHVLRALSVSPVDVTYLDDTRGHVDAALTLGIDARQYVGIHSLRAAVST